MKHSVILLLFAAVATCAMLPALRAEAPAKVGTAATKGTTYTATVTGMVCASCRAHVTEAMKKLPGVTEVEVTKGTEPNTQQVTFAASEAGLTQQDAINALGEAASRYQVLSFEKKK